MTKNKITWNEENTARLVELAGDISGTVSQETVAAIAEELKGSTRSVSSKLRNMKYDVEKVGAKAPSWTEAQEAELRSLIEANPGQYTYAELASVFEGGEFNFKQVQGKVLSMELTKLVKGTEKKAAPRTYTPEQEATFISMVNSGASVEALSAEFNKPINSVRGKALSLLRSGDISAMPAQESSKAKAPSDFLQGIDVESKTVAEIAKATGRSERGIKSALTRRGISAVDYDGAAKHAKLEAKKED